MDKEASNTRQRIVDAAYLLFYKTGVMRTSIDAIAMAAGITKRTLYQHFDSKAALIDAVLADQHSLMLARIQEWAQPDSNGPAAMLTNLFAAFEHWATQRHWRGSGFTRAAIEFADSPGHPARLAARRHKAAVEAWLADALADHGIADAKQLARELVLLIEGCHVLVLIHHDTSYIRVAAEAAAALLQRRAGEQGYTPVEKMMNTDADPGRPNDSCIRS
jgi:AcrR family transcriptional regulator